MDDAMITCLGPQMFHMVTNAACRDKDIAYLKEHVEEINAEKHRSIQWAVLQGRGLIALQGPMSESILQDVLVGENSETDLKTLYFGQSRSVSVRMPQGSRSPPVLVSRGGYTGEDGFEISIPGPITASVTEVLLRSAGPDKLRLAGLGARDTLRLEAGMCLYGHDLDDSTTPIEAGLSWIVGKHRRVEGGFLGAEVINRQLAHIKDGGQDFITRRRVGLVVEGAPAREGAEIQDENGNVVGTVTSGCPSPTLGQNIAMGYVKNGLHKAGTKLAVVVRGKPRGATVTKMPFVETKYRKPETVSK